MITVSIFGGLGNQMFQYAAGKSLAERYRVPLVLDLSGFQAHPDRSFLLNQLQIPEAVAVKSEEGALPRTQKYFFQARRRDRFDRMMTRFGMPKWPSSARRYREPHFHFDGAFGSLGPDTSLFGYFQSERYFISIAEQLRRYFLPRDALSEAAHSIGARIFESELPVSIHIRRGDYLQAGTAEVHGILNEAYYRKALAQIESLIGTGFDLFVFSDDQEAAAQVLQFVSHSRLTFVPGNADRPWEDMALMARCRHHIIANSSFSWWGAWLNHASEKIVVAPRSWFSEKGLQTRHTRDIYPAGWITV